jgi:hypothetical protein
MPKDQLIKGQTGERRPFGKLYKKKSEPKFIRPKPNNNGLQNEENKNNIFLNIQKANCKFFTRNKYDNNMDTNRTNSKRKDLASDNQKNKKIKNLKNALDKNNLISIILKAPSNPNFRKVPKNKNLDYSNDIEKEKEKEKETERAKKIMETTIIKIGNDYLSLKEIGKRVTNTSYGHNSELSIVKNYFSKTHGNSFINNSSDKNNNHQRIRTQNNQNNVNRDIHTSVEQFLTKSNNKSLTSKNKNFNNNKLPSIPFNTFSNYPTSYLSQNYFHFSKYNPKNKNKVNLFKMTRYNQRNNYKTFFNKNKNKFNVILTNDNPMMKNKSFSNKKRKKIK